MKKNEMLLYRVNAVASAVAMLYLVFNTAQTIVTLNMIDVSAEKIRVMEIILINVFLSFLVFIVANEIKRYNMRWSLIGLAVGIFQLLRCFFIPNGSERSRLIVGVLLLTAGVFLCLASIESIVKCGRYRAAKKELECRTSV